MNPFFRVKVDYVVSGGARVSWEIWRHFVDPGPYTFQLQAGHTGLEDADDWINVGSPVVDTFFADDVEQRLFGKTLDLYYRVQLTTSVGVYYSNTQNCDGLLSQRDWILAQEMTRKEQLRHTVQTSVNGFLLKARRYGPPCTTCTDAVVDLTGEIANSHCPDCFGTGFEFGYFDPLPGVYADVTQNKSKEHRDPQRGMINESIIQARFIGDPLIYTYDVWINGTSDLRYYVGGVAVASQIRGVPLVYDVELRKAAFTDVIYTLPLDKDLLTAARQRILAKKAQICPTNQERSDLDLAAAELHAKRLRSSRR